HRVVGNRSAGVRYRVANFGGAGDAIGRTHVRRTRLAALIRAYFEPVTELTIAARAIDGQVRAAARRFIAVIERARNAIVAYYKLPRNAALGDVASLNPVACEPVVAKGIVWRVTACATRRIAAVRGAEEAIVAIYGGSGLTNSSTARLNA